MSENEIPKEVKDFVFQYIDSVEQLEILLLLNAEPHKVWTVGEVHQTLRSNMSSVEKRLNLLAAQKLIDKKEGGFQFKPEGSEKNEIIRQLSGAYKVHRHRIFEMIFSPMKKARDIAEAFVIAPPKDPKGDSNG
ncbi:hypothetical protein [Bdellovibrio sp. HCB337]|uniref:hypothetical protein n=1 Tax=Bdellovibrio sp. HCB337 TaxID=3394358 RepID=UPI0039A429B2